MAGDPYPKGQQPLRGRKKASLTLSERKTLYARTGGTCEWCGASMEFSDMDDHHRKLRGQGGGWEMSNQLGVHHDCHVNQPRSIHMNPHVARQYGAMCKASDTPAEIPVYIGGAMWLLTDDGGKEPYNSDY